MSFNLRFLLIFILIDLILVAGCRGRDGNNKLNQVDSGSFEGYKKALNEYLSRPSVIEGWDWFMYQSHYFDANPTILIKLLPLIDPDIWGKPEEKFSKFGHFVLPGDENRTLPSSLGISKFPNKNGKDSLYVTSETCGTCHIGRVRILDSITKNKFNIEYLLGGVNTQLDIRNWRSSIIKTVDRHLMDRSKFESTTRLIRMIVAEKPLGYFFQDPVEDQKQRRLFLEAGKTEEVLSNFVKHSTVFSDGKSRQLKSSYTNLKSPSIEAGHQGQMDASGDLISHLLPSTFGMPKIASMTDIPSVWMQSEYSIGQWDGSVSSQFIRNLAAQIAVAASGHSIDRRVASFALQFTTDLPAPKYPFRMQINQETDQLIAQGKALFLENCAFCHGPNNIRIYPEINTDLNRANIITKLGGLVVGKAFSDACKAKLPDEIEMPPCQNLFQSIGKEDAKAKRGYPAKPLAGIWARAPYLHNGSVPTLRQLLVPSTRPIRFVIGSLGYDEKDVGFNWKAEEFEVYKKFDPQIGFLDTLEDGMSNKGHDQLKLEVEGKFYRLDWTFHEGDQPNQVDALLEYLKTL